MATRSERLRKEPVMLSSIEGLAKHAWDTAQEHILKKWKCQLFVHMYMQAEARAYFRGLYNWMSTPVILLNTSASAAIFLSTRSDVKDYILLAMTLSAAVLATLTRSMQVAELYQQHGSSCLRYSSLLHDIESVLNMRIDLRPSALSYIEKVKSDMDNIMSAQAEPPDHVVRSFERTYGRVDGLLYGEDVVRVVLTNIRTNSYLQDIYSQSKLARRVSTNAPQPPSQPSSSSQVRTCPDSLGRWSMVPPFMRSSIRPSVRPPFLKMSYPPQEKVASGSQIDSEELRRIVASVDRIHISIDNQRSNGTTMGVVDVPARLVGRVRGVDAPEVSDVVLSLFESTPTTSIFDRSEESTPVPTTHSSCVSPIVWDTASHSDIERSLSARLTLSERPPAMPATVTVVANTPSPPIPMHSTSPFAVPVSTGFSRPLLAPSLKPCAALPELLELDDEPGPTVVVLHKK